MRSRSFAWGLGWTILFALAGTVTMAAAEWNAGEGFRFRELTVVAGKPYLTQVLSNRSGIHFRSDIPDEKGIENSVRLLGTGVAAGDVDGDGWCDLFFSSMGGRSALYRNKGDWRFEDVTASAGVGLEGRDSNGCALADMDGDGDLDLVVNTLGGGTRLYWNDGGARFTEATNSGLSNRGGCVSMALADVDGNGTLDLYVATYAKNKIEDRPTTKILTAKVDGKLVVSSLDGIPITSPELTNRYYIDASNTIRELGEPDVLYLHDGKGKFSAVSWTNGWFLDEAGAPLKLPHYEWGLGVMFRDINGDGAPDLYVCNDLFTPDRMWINDGKGKFREAPALTLRQASLFSMGVDFADLNHDGHDDFFVVDMLSPLLAERKVQIIGVEAPRLTVGKFDDRPTYKRNTLFLNRGDGTYAEIGQYAGLEATGWSWSPMFLDVDLDGHEDVLTTAGYYRDPLNADAINLMRILRGRAGRPLTKEEYRQLKTIFPPLPQQNKVFRNRGDLTFAEKTENWGFSFTGISQGGCLADLDNDGDLDVVVICQNAPAAIYRSESSAPRVAVRLKGKAPNTRGIGAKIRVFGGEFPLSQEMICGGRYLGSDDPVRVFAAPMGKDLRIEVTWRNGTRSVVNGAQANRVYEIDEASAVARPKEIAAAAQPWFEDLSRAVGHIHPQLEYDDFQRQPTLPHKLSQAGPSLSWLGPDDDGNDRLAVGAASGGSLGLLLNTSAKSFQNIASRALKPLPQRDATVTLGLDKNRLLVGARNYENANNNSVIHLMDLARKESMEIASIPECIGPMALADVNGDGQLDLFVGGRAMPGRYPDAANSYLFLGHHGHFAPDAGNAAALSKIGMVSGAVFSDLNGDGLPELILACEWGAVRIFQNEKGKFTERTSELGLAGLTGLWNGVAAGDFDGDGRMDLIASNLGRNTRFESFRSKPLRLYHGKTAAGDVACLIASYDERAQKWQTHCDYATIQQALPETPRKFPSHTAYSLAKIEDLMAGQMEDARFFEATCLESMVFLNRGDRFEAKALPMEAQFAPAFGIAVADFDGDGAQDVFLSQNFFGGDKTTARYDGGRGLMLKGDGKGNFAALSGDQSGIKLYGEQRGCAVSDYDRDGRVDLAVGQNGGPTALFRNLKSAVGLRVKLRGGPGNPNGIGAMVRLVGAKASPAYEVGGGGGYLSQNSPILVMHAPPYAKAIWVRWPGGAVKTYPIPENSRELTLAP